MSLSRMKDELHARLWTAQQRWFALKAQGESKLSLKMQGLGRRDEPTFATRLLIFTGATRIAYERELKRFLDYAHDVLGRRDNAQIDKRDFRAYLEARIAQGAARTELNKIRAAIVKFGALCRLPPYVYFPLDLDHPPMYPCGFSSSSGGLE